MPIYNVPTELVGVNQTITGTAYASDGSTLATGARVCLVRKDGNIRDIIRKTNADATTAEYSFDNLPPGEYDVIIAYEDYPFEV